MNSPSPSRGLSRRAELSPPQVNSVSPSAGFAARIASPRDDAGWLITLSDLSLLLLCFFIVLHVADRRRLAPETIQAGAQQTSTESAAEIEPEADAEDAAPAVELPASLTISFAPGTADLSREFFPVLEEAVAAAQKEPELKLEIIGHTDDRPIATREFPTNWELSAARASGVARYLILKGIDPARLSVESYAAFRPVLPNSNIEGREANRRVEVRFYRAGDEESANR